MPKFKIGDLVIQTKGPYLHPFYVAQPGLIVGYENVPSVSFLRIEGYLAYKVLVNDELLTLGVEDCDEHCELLA